MSIWLVTSKLRWFLNMLMVMAIMDAGGCHEGPTYPVHAVTHGSAVVAVDLSVPTHVEVVSDNLVLSTARHSWTHFAVQVDCSQLPGHPTLWLPRFMGEYHQPAAGVTLSAFQILSVPVDLNDAEYVRQTGEPGVTQAVPRVLLPLAINHGSIDWSALRDPAHPARKDLHPSTGSVLIWIDVHVSTDTTPGDFAGNCELADAEDHESAGIVPIRLTVENLALPKEPHLHFAAPLDWNNLLALHPSEFERDDARRLARNNPYTSVSLHLLDQYLQLGHENKTDFYIPRLQPIVKWPLGKAPEIDWSNFDSIVEPWLTGKAFPDHLPISFWPMPGFDSLDQFDLASRIQYWQLAAQHFDQRQWLDRMPVVFQSELAGPITEADSLLLSAEARLILATHPRIGAMLPLHDDQTQLASTGNPSAIAMESTSRLLTVAPGLVCASPIRDWPAEALPPRHWIDASAANGPLETTGLSSEQSVRTLAWLAFSRDASLVLCGNPLPTHPDLNQPVPSNQLILCYPGQWFGVDTPLATVQLKWMREAGQDYEYLMLASQNGNRADALHMCRLITKPLQLQPMQKYQPSFNLLAGTADPHASEQARQLLVAGMKSNPVDQTKPTSTDPIQLQTLRWFTDRQRPTLLATGARWLWNLNPDPSATTEPGKWIEAQLSVHFYNPADEMVTGNILQWTIAPGGWESHPEPIDIPSLARYQVSSFTASARFDLNKIGPDSRQPIQLDFVDGFTGQTVPCKLVLPVATSERRQKPLNLDGSLDDWYAADAVQLDQPLVRMLNRPALQSQELQLADTPSSIYTSWSDDNFYIAFRLAGVTASDLRSTRNFVQYDHGRAWGEDLCEMLIQPIYIDNTVGPTLHVICKPGGNWVEQQLTAPIGSPQASSSWQPFEACGVRYASGVDADQQIWRGELAIPWKAIAAAGHGRPALLRFNFIQHQQSNAQSASWAGPIDQSRDENIAGLLLLKEP